MIVGATFTGPEVQDFLHAATVAVIGELPLERIAHAVPSFPTRSEVALPGGGGWACRARRPLAARLG